MRKSHLIGAMSAIVFSFTTLTVHAALIGVLPATPGDTDWQVYYDDVLDITWIANANLAASNTFGTSGINLSGRVTWDTANTWIVKMNADGGTGYLGYSNWRLPTMMDTGTPGCNYSTTGGTDCGYNVQTGSATTMVYSEMASLWYDTLGNKAYYDTSGNGPQPGWGLSNTGPFSNMQSNFYWSGSEFDSSGAWHFHFGNGFQNTFSKSSFNFACAVRSEG